MWQPYIVFPVEVPGHENVDTAQFAFLPVNDALMAHIERLSKVVEGEDLADARVYVRYLPRVERSPAWVQQPMMPAETDPVYFEPYGPHAQATGNMRADLQAACEDLLAFGNLAPETDPYAVEERERRYVDQQMLIVRRHTFGLSGTLGDTPIELRTPQVPIENVREWYAAVSVGLKWDRPMSNSGAAPRP